MTKHKLKSKEKRTPSKEKKKPSKAKRTSSKAKRTLEQPQQQHVPPANNRHLYPRSSSFMPAPGQAKRTLELPPQHHIPPTNNPQVYPPSSSFMLAPSHNGPPRYIHAPGMTSSPNVMATASRMALPPSFTVDSPEMDGLPNYMNTAPMMAQPPSFTADAPEMDGLPNYMATAPMMAQSPAIMDTAPEMAGSRDFIATAPRIDHSPTLTATSFEMPGAPDFMATAPGMNGATIGPFTCMLASHLLPGTPSRLPANISPDETPSHGHTYSQHESDTEAVADSQRTAASENQPPPKKDVPKLQCVTPIDGGFLEHDSVEIVSDLVEVFYKVYAENWKQLGPEIHEAMWQEFQNRATWDPVYPHLYVRQCFITKAKDRFRDKIWWVRKRDEKPDWISPQIYAKLKVYWRSKKFLKMSKQGKANRKSLKGGSVHIDGSKCFKAHELAMQKALGREVATHEVFKRTHQNVFQDKKRIPDGVEKPWVDPRSKESYATFEIMYEEFTQSLASVDESLSQPTKEDSLRIWNKAVKGPYRGRIYGTGIRVGDGKIHSTFPGQYSSTNLELETMKEKMARNEKKLAKQAKMLQKFADFYKQSTGKSLDSSDDENDEDEESDDEENM